MTRRSASRSLAPACVFTCGSAVRIAERISKAARMASIAVHPASGVPRRVGRRFRRLMPPWMPSTPWLPRGAPGAGESPVRPHRFAKKNRGTNFRSRRPSLDARPNPVGLPGAFGPPAPNAHPRRSRRHRCAALAPCVVAPGQLVGTGSVSADRSRWKRNRDAAAPGQQECESLRPWRRW
jgi:hypothetical protein